MLTTAVIPTRRTPSPEIRDIIGLGSGDFKPADQLFFDQIAETAVENETLKTAAKVNSMENFKPVFDRMLEGLFIDRMEGNEDIFDRLMNDPEFRNIAANELLRDVYNRLRISNG